MERRSLLQSAVGLLSGMLVSGCTAPQDNRTTRSTPGTETTSEQALNSGEDVDDDGFTVCEEQKSLDGADVGRMDIFVEIAWTNGNRPDPNKLGELVEIYENAPVKSSDEDTNGINLHLEYGSEVPRREGAFGIADLQEYRAEHFENRGRGYHYALFVDEVEEPAIGRADGGHVLVQSKIPDDSKVTTTQIFAHELGHALGLSQETFEGIDNPTPPPFSEYPSMMNYNSMRTGNLNFSDGTHSPNDFNDWGYIEENLHVPNKTVLNRNTEC